MANTTNFNWETPDDIDLVKDGAAAIRTLGSAIDTSLVDLKGGTTGQVLSKATNTDMDFTWVAQDDSNAIQNAIVDAKGDLISATAADTPARLAVGTDNQRLVAASGEATGLKYVSDTQNTVIDAKGDLLVGTAADTVARLAVGTNTYVLTADSAEATGLKWAAPSGGSSFVGCSAAATGLQSITTATWTAQNFTATDLFDTDAFHDPSSNSSRITIPTGKGGKYHFSFRIYIDTASTTGRRIVALYKNGSIIDSAQVEYAVVSRFIGLNTGIINLNAGDYIQAFVYQSSGSTLDTYGEYCSFAVQYLGA